MPVDAGDVKYQPGQTVTLDAGGNTVEGGEAVTFDGSGNITRATDTDFVIGTTQHTKKDGDHDDEWPVVIAGLGVAVETDFSASAGDFLQPAAGGDGRYQDAGAAGPDTSFPVVLHEEDSGNNVYVAMFR